MKINCTCGSMILDQGAHKGHFISDGDWDALFDAIDDAIEGGSHTSAEARCMAVRNLFGRAARSAWQCNACGRVYFPGEGAKLVEWAPAQRASKPNLFVKRLD